MIRPDTVSVLPHAATCTSGLDQRRGGRDDGQTSAERSGVLDPVGNVVCGAQRQIQAKRCAADGGYGLRDEFVNVAADFRRHATPVIYGTVRLIERDDESFLAWARPP